jgi:hypothetical protein
MVAVIPKQESSRQAFRQVTAHVGQAGLGFPCLANVRSSVVEKEWELPGLAQRNGSGGLPSLEQVA